MAPAAAPARADALVAAAPTLRRWLAARMGAKAVRLDPPLALAGGAVQRHWRLDATAEGGPMAGRHVLVLRADPDIPLPESLPKPAEFAVLERVCGAGVPVPEPFWLCEETDILGRAFVVSAFVPGDADRARLTGMTETDALVEDLARALAAIHACAPPEGTSIEGPGARVARLAGWRTLLRLAPPGIRRGLDRLAERAPADGPAALVHRDFRTGNFLVSQGRLAAVLDWEFAGAGDPHEDIGWFCAACWRGGAPAREAGGLGQRAAFYRAYERAGGGPVDPARVAFWELFAHVRWAMLATAQGLRAEAGEGPRGELEEAAARVPGLARDIAAMMRADG